MIGERSRIKFQFGICEICDLFCFDGECVLYIFVLWRNSFQKCVIDRRMCNLARRGNVVYMWWYEYVNETIYFPFNINSIDTKLHIVYKLECIKTRWKLHVCCICFIHYNCIILLNIPYDIIFTLRSLLRLIWFRLEKIYSEHIIFQSTEV